MRRIFLAFMVFMLSLGVISASAGEGCCAAKAKAAKALSDEKAEVKADHVCPDVTERTALMNFHEAMHPMHMAVQAGDFDGLREKLSTLVEAGKGVADYKCDGYEKCTEICRKNFDGKKGELMESIDGLKEACKGQDNEKVAAAFNVMHEAYITFAGTCVHEEGKPAEVKSAAETQ